jgi:hypothetical protein
LSEKRDAMFAITGRLRTRIRARNENDDTDDSALPRTTQMSFV